MILPPPAGVSWRSNVENRPAFYISTPSPPLEGEGVETYTVRIRNSLTNVCLLLFSVVDPDPHGSSFILVGCIGIRIALEMRIRIWIQEGKNDPQKIFSCFEVLDVHF
jgi:hypothetical protein